MAALFSVRRALALAPVLLALAAAPAPVPASAASPEVDVLVLGDSLTAGFGLAPGLSMPARLQDGLARSGRPVRLLAAGVFGDTAEGGLRRVDGLPLARVTVVALGANDLLEGVPAARTEAALHAVVRRLQARGSRVVLAGGRSPFSPRAGFDALFARVAAAEHAPLAPDVLAGVSRARGTVQDDGLHPNAAGAALVASRLVAPVLAQLDAAR